MRHSSFASQWCRAISYCFPAVVLSRLLVNVGLGYLRTRHRKASGSDLETQRMAGANKTQQSSSPAFASTTLLLATAIVLLASACGTRAASSSASVSVGAFDRWYRSFIKDRHYTSCVQEIAQLDPSRDEKADWDAGRRQFYVKAWSDPRIVMDTAGGRYVPGLENCDGANIAAGRDIGKLEDVFAISTPGAEACTKAAFAYVASYNSLRAKRHPIAARELCLGR